MTLGDRCLGGPALYFLSSLLMVRRPVKQPVRAMPSVYKRIWIMMFKKPRPTGLNRMSRWHYALLLLMFFTFSFYSLPTFW